MRKQWPWAAIMFGLVLALALPGRGAVTVDLSSPKAAAKSLYQATEARDAAALRQIFYAPSADEHEMVNAFADLVMAAQALSDAAKSKFGGNAGPLGVSITGQQTLADIDKAPVETTGDEATMTLPGETRPVRFKNVRGQWQLEISSWTDAPTGGMKAQLAVIRSMTTAMRDVTDQITSGKITTPHDAQTALQQAGNDAMIAAANLAAKAATQPASQPATQP